MNHSLFLAIENIFLSNHKFSFGRGGLLLLGNIIETIVYELSSALGLISMLFSIDLPWTTRPFFLKLYLEFFRPTRKASCCKKELVLYNFLLNLSNMVVFLSTPRRFFIFNDMEVILAAFKLKISFISDGQCQDNVLQWHPIVESSCLPAVYRFTKESIAYRIRSSWIVPNIKIKLWEFETQKYPSMPSIETGIHLLEPRSIRVVNLLL